jgi:hypothetical protein
MHRHEEDWAVVGPNLGNANPRTLRSWAIFYNAYAPHINQNAGPATSAAGHNASYKKKLLDAFAPDELAELLEVEWILQQRIRANGGQIYYEPAAQTFHLNVSRWSTWINNHFAMGRVFGAQRSRDWNAPQRLFAAARSPIVPFVRYTRHCRCLRASGDHQFLPPTVLLLIFFGLCLSALGEMVGSVAGMGQSLVQFSHAEFHRETGMNERDRLELFELDAENGLELVRAHEAM